MAEKGFAQKVREYFGMPEPGQKKIGDFTKHAEEQAKQGKVETKAGKAKKKAKKKDKKKSK